MTAKPQPSNASSALGCVFILAVVGVIVYSCSSSNSDTTEDSDTDDGSMAEIMCEEFVSERLKAPASAEFPGADLVEPLGGDQYTVTAAVDSQNGFGAMIRTGYVCTIQNTGGDEWTLVSLDMDE
jgi:hypothetical protein